VSDVPGSHTNANCGDELLISRTTTSRFDSPRHADAWFRQAREWSYDHPTTQIVETVQEPLEDGRVRASLRYEFVIYGPHCPHLFCPMTGCLEAKHVVDVCERTETCPECGPRAWCPSHQYRVLATDCPHCRTP
jgi:hypothetical protein